MCTAWSENRFDRKNSRLGGTCLNVGCIPSKALLHSTEIFHELSESADNHGILLKGISHDLSKLMKKKDSVIDQLGKGVQALGKEKGVSVIHGTAKLYLLIKLKSVPMIRQNYSMPKR